KAGAPALPLNRNFGDNPSACGRSPQLADSTDFRVYPTVGTLRPARQVHMQLRMFWSNIHRAVITHADLHYEGSCTIDADLMDAADILPNQELHIWNI